MILLGVCADVDRIPQREPVMRAMVVEVGPEIEQLVFEIYRRPEQRVIQILASQSAD